MPGGRRALRDALRDHRLAGDRQMGATDWPSHSRLFEDGIIEVACWSHARRYVFKSLETDGARARHALAVIQSLFKLEPSRGATRSPSRYSTKRPSRRPSATRETSARRCAAVVSPSQTPRSPHPAPASSYAHCGPAGQWLCHALTRALRAGLPADNWP